MNPKKISDAFAAWIAAKSSIPAETVFSAFSLQALPTNGALVVSCSVDDPHERNTFGGFRADVFFRIDVPFSHSDVGALIAEFYDFIEGILSDTPVARAEMNAFFRTVDSDSDTALAVASFRCVSLPEPAISELGATCEAQFSVVGEIVSKE